MKEGSKQQLDVEIVSNNESIQENYTRRNNINSFQRMKDLQSLIKKESAMKELCKK
jgi:hypothetical protein